MLKIATIIGARPQFIKASAISRVVEVTGGVSELLIHTGQHYDKNMSSIFFEDLEMQRPAYNLGIGSENHGAQTGRMLEAIEEILIKEKPDCVVVYGDTNSTLAGALASSKMHIYVAHVEAGLRSFNRKMPEEINRVLTDHLSDILFAPTEIAVRNLSHEGLPNNKISLVGDVMYDVALHYGVIAEKRSRIINVLNLGAKEYILATIHRAENTDNVARLRAIFEGLEKVSKDVPIVLPLHPRTKSALLREGLLENVAGIHVIEPVGYLDMIMLEKNSTLIVTDSGGVQKEAFFYRVPCITLRDETEWMELVDLGWNSIIAPQNGSEIAAAISSGIGRCGIDANPYGEGRTAEAIVQQLLGAQVHS